MIVITSKQATNVQAVLASLSGEFKLRTVPAIAQEAGITTSEAQDICASLGFVAKRRRSDGAVLYGISGRVEGNDELHVPVTAWVNPAAPMAAQAPAVDQEYEAAKAAVKAALQDGRFRSRTIGALLKAGNCTQPTLDRIIGDLGAHRHDGQFVKLAR